MKTRFKVGRCCCVPDDVETVPLEARLGASSYYFNGFPWDPPRVGSFGLTNSNSVHWEYPSGLTTTCWAFTAKFGTDLPSSVSSARFRCQGYEVTGYESDAVTPIEPNATYRLKASLHTLTDAQATNSLYDFRLWPEYVGVESVEWSSPAFPDFPTPGEVLTPDVAPLINEIIPRLDFDTWFVVYVELTSEPQGPGFAPTQRTLFTLSGVNWVSFEWAT